MATQNTPSTAAYASAYCRRYGIAIVPLPPRTKRPLANNWGNEVITDAAAAAEFFTKHPDWNMGAALGPSGLCSLDVDDLDATAEIFAEFGWNLEELRANYPTIQGRPGGMRIMFRVPAGVALAYHALTWPKKSGAGRMTVFELRAAQDQQRQDVLPPSIHPDTGEPYQWLTKPNGTIPEPPDFLLQIWKNWDALKPQMQAVCPWAPRQEPPKPARQAAPREGASVIDTYNASTSIEQALSRYGYKQQGKRWLSPHSGTGLPGVSVFDDNRCWIHHASDPLCSDESGQPVGPFDLFQHYEHGGDMRKAVRTAAESLGMQRQLAPTPARPPAIDPETGEILAAAPVPAGTMPRYLAVQQWGLEATDKGVPHASVANVVRVLSMDENLAQKIWFDEFLDRICTVWPAGEVREWTDADDVRLQVYIQETLGMPKLGKQAVQDAVMLVARMDTRNEAMAYLDGLQWDGVERLPHFFPDCFGTDDTEYTRAVGLSFWLSLVARVTRPGCKVDTMVVLEGLQGAGKSRALSIIGGKWFTEATQAPTDKDFYMNLAGKMLVEIGEMDAFNRAEVTKVKQVITCQVDRYRAPYERRAADHPRRCVFAGTTNRDDWNKDETGARRFLPLTVMSVNHDAIQAQRDQFFAEAVARLNRGENWWTLPVEATLEQQEARRDVDELEATMAEWLLGRSEVTVTAVMNDLMKIPLERQDKGIQMRISKALRVLGWKRETVWRGGRVVKAWLRGGKAQKSPGVLAVSQHDDDEPY